MSNDRSRHRRPRAAPDRSRRDGKRPPWVSGTSPKPSRSRQTPVQRRPSQSEPWAARSLLEEIRATARPGQADRAVKAFQEAVGLLERGREAAALKPAEEAKDLAPRSGAAREVLGIALYRLERYREALRELQAYRRITGRVDQNHLIADAHRALGSPEKAVEPVRDVLKARRVPDEVRGEAAIVGASALADLGRFDEALGMLRAVRNKGQVARPHDVRIWYVTGDILERARRPREAEEEFRQIMRRDAGAYDVAERLARLTQGPDQPAG